MKALKQFFLLGCLGVAGTLAGCQRAPDRQDNLWVKPSGYSRTLPTAKSIEEQYIPSKDGDSPNSMAAYHVVPGMSYDDNTLDDNLAGSIEHVDYYAALKKAGWQRWLQAEGPYTVLAMPNQALEAYVATWPGFWQDDSNHERLKRFIGQTIIKGRWDLPRIRREAHFNGGNAVVMTLSGEPVKLHPLVSSGMILVQSPYGETHLVGGSYPQSNGILYMTDSVLPFAP